MGGEGGGRREGAGGSDFWDELTFLLVVLKQSVHKEQYLTKTKRTPEHR